jgi:hypothetical protein
MVEKEVLVERQLNIVFNKVEKPTQEKLLQRNIR